MLLDEDGTAAEIVGTGTIGATTLLKPRAVAAGMRSFTGGNRQRKTGRRPMQLGATVVIGPGNEILYEDFEDFPGDHAPLGEVLAVLADASGAG